MRKLYLSCCVMLICLLACNQEKIYQQHHVYAQQVWPVTAIQRFDFYIQDPFKAYDIILLVHNRLTYPYQNLFVSYEVKDEQGNVLKNGLQACQLFESKTGKPLGKGWWCNIKKHQFILLPTYQFPKPGYYQIYLTQFMRTDDLIGIEAIGIQINTSSIKQPN